MNIWIQSVTIIFLLTFLTGCHSDQGEVNREPSAGERVLTSSHADGIQLSAEQRQLAGITLGQPQMREISSYVECAGVVEVPPQSTASVYTPVNGFVQSVKHLPGQYVKKGALLTTLEHPDLIRLQREFLESNSHLEALRRDYERKELLAGSEAASQRSLEQARAEFEMERARNRGLRAELQLIGIPVEKLEEEGEIQPQLSIYAPVGGFLNSVNVNIGKLVSPSDLLFEIVDTRHVHLELQVYAKDLAKLRKGQRVEASMPGNAQSYQAEIYLVGPVIQPETKTALVHGHFVKEPVPLTPGTYMHAHIYIDEQEAKVVPETALVREGEQAFVFVERNDHFIRLPVELGRTDGEYVEILGLQLAPEEQVALEGAYYINGSFQEGE